ncbi:uncharacterized protein LOC107027683 [Solanum pennellii]|uniref:Uncharacterized protein LOC107027683 n=1 Tax=Solanum pennellii TaxID=28526 RepID=A0ABM1HE88_SOLPN|nr:uncharacterized protein LOC107027683 [Solanum pennellii]
MVNLTKLEFTALQSSGRNYLSWVLDAEIHLDAMGLRDTIKEENKASNQNCTRAMIFLRHHLDEILKIEYLTVKDPLVLWKNLKERFDHLKMVIHPKARYDWMHLRPQDFKSTHEYNSAMFRITSQLKLCGERVSEIDMMEKTFSTFHASNVLLQQQYREKAEQNDDLLLKNHENRPTRSEPLPEVNEAYAHHARRGKGRGPNRGRGRGRGRERGRDYGKERNSIPEEQFKPSAVLAYFGGTNRFIGFRRHSGVRASVYGGSSLALLVCSQSLHQKRYRHILLNVSLVSPSGLK